MEQEAVNAWLHDNLSIAGEQERRGQLLFAYFMENLSLDDVRAFYQLPAFVEAAQAKGRK